MDATHVVPRVVKLREIESKDKSCQGLEAGGNNCLMGMKFQLRKMKNVGEMVSDEGCLTTY